MKIFVSFISGDRWSSSSFPFCCDYWDRWSVTLDDNTHTAPLLLGFLSIS